MNEDPLGRTNVILHVLKQSHTEAAVPFGTVQEFAARAAREIAEEKKEEKARPDGRRWICTITRVSRKLCGEGAFGFR